MSAPGRTAAVPVVALSGFPAGAMLWESQGATAQRSLTVIVKATFALRPGELDLAPQQDPLLEETRWDDHVLASLRWSGDYAPSKKRVDVSLVGHAYAPGGAPTTSVTARLVVGALDKRVVVNGDRAWKSSPRGAAEPGAAESFVRFPLRYERATISADNPIGVDDRAPPNLELPEGGVGTPCFGPIAPTWRARRRLLDEGATLWAYGIARDPRLGGPPPGPLPPGFDFAFFNAAPPDQQLDLVRPGMEIVLEHLHRDHPRLVTQVPKLRPQVFATPAPGAARTRVEEIIVRCDTLWIDTDRGVLVLAWRGVAEAPARGPVGDIVVAGDATGRKLRWAQVEKWLGEKTMPTLRLGPDGRPEPDPPDEVPPDDLARRHDSVKEGPLGVDANAIADDLTRPVVEKARVAPRPDAPPESGARPVAPSPRPGLALRKDLTLERCAEIAAALGQKGADRAVILRGRNLTEASWGVVEKQWQRIVAAEAEQSDRTTADAFDDAFVLAQERLPRPIDMAAYARLSVGVERGEVGRILGELELELADLVRLHRVWERRSAASPEVAAELARAIANARETA